MLHPEKEDKAFHHSLFNHLLSHIMVCLFQFFDVLTCVAPPSRISPSVPVVWLLPVVPCVVIRPRFHVTCAGTRAPRTAHKGRMNCKTANENIFYQ
jgi:hypothetical protein